MTLKNSIVSLLLILAVGLSSWSIFVSKNNHSYKPAPTSGPDAYMEGVSATLINKLGTPALKIVAPKIVHHLDDTTDITTPHITVFRQSPEPWHINSDYAKASRGIAEIFFWSNVIIHHFTDIVTPQTTMTTASLTVYPKQQVARTPDPVIIKQPNTIINAVGMSANLAEGTVKLFSHARGEYVPSS